MPDLPREPLDRRTQELLALDVPPVPEKVEVEVVDKETGAKTKEKVSAFSRDEARKNYDALHLQIAKIIDDNGGRITPRAAELQKLQFDWLKAIASTLDNIPEDLAIIHKYFDDLDVEMEKAKARTNRRDNPQSDALWELQVAWNNASMKLVDGIFIEPVRDTSGQ